MFSSLSCLINSYSNNYAAKESSGNENSLDSSISYEKKYDVPERVCLLKEVSTDSFYNTISYIVNDANSRVSECNISFFQFLRDRKVRAIAEEMLDQYMEGLAWEGLCPPTGIDPFDKVLDNALTDSMFSNSENFDQNIWEEFQQFQYDIVRKSNRLETNSPLQLEVKVGSENKSNTITTTCLSLLALTGMQGGVASFRHLGQEYE